MLSNPFERFWPAGLHPQSRHLYWDWIEKRVIKENNHYYSEYRQLWDQYYNHPSAIQKRQVKKFVNEYFYLPLPFQYMTRQLFHIICVFLDMRT